MAKTRRSRLGKVFYELFCLPVIIDCHCEECEPRGSPELDILSVSSESEVFVTAQTSLISLMEDKTQDNVEIVPRKKGKWKKRLKVVKDFFCEPVILDCSCEECKLKASPEIKSIDEESEVYVTAQISLTSLVEDDNEEIVPRKKGKWKKRLKVVKDFFCEPVILDCSCEECKLKASPEIKSIDEESEVYVTAQISLTSLVEDDNEEIVPRKKGKWKKRLKVVKDFFCEPVILDCHCKECEPKASPEIKSIDEESEVYVTAQTSLTSLVEDNTQDTEEVFFDCLNELCSPETSPELDSQSIDGESEVYVTAQISLISLVEVNATQDNVEVFFDCLNELCSPETSPELVFQSIDGESEVYVTAQTSLISLVEVNATKEKVEIVPRKKGKWKKRLKVVKDFFCEPVILDCHCKECEPKASPEIKSIDEESEVYVTAQTSLTSLVEDNTQDTVEVAPRKKGKWKRRLKVVKDFFCEPVILDCHCEKCVLQDPAH